jgi:hypothetical protein
VVVAMGGNVLTATPSLPHAAAAMGNRPASPAKTPNRAPFTADDVRQVERPHP